MKGAFTESFAFTEWVSEFLPDDVYDFFQQELLEHPTKGRPIPGCGGLRKIRVSEPRRNKGKRGGARVIYLYVPEAKWFYLLDIYGKDEKEDLTGDEKKLLGQLADEFSIYAKLVASRWKGKPDK